ncbi:MAG: hypothetical protein ACKOC5_15905 [Chloroflexota bacterium]
MADVRCPMCGKPNPADRDVCQFCQARLKPVWLGDLNPDQPAGGGEEFSLPGWLSDLRQPDNQPPGKPGSAAPGAQDGLPDWLSGLRSEPELPAENVPAQDAASDAPAGGGRDWLDEILGDAPGSAEEWDSPASGEYEDSAAGDWLSRIGGQEPASDKPGQAANGEADFLSQPIPDAADSGLPDWLNSTPAADDLPDWLKPEPGAAAPQPGPAAPDWMASASEAQPADELPDWMSSANEAPPSGGLPDWLSAGAASMSASSTDTPSLGAEVFPSAQPAQPSGDLPDWLNPPAQADLPDWLSGSGDAHLADDTPDWLKPEPAAPPTPGQADLPDWMASANASAPAELPDWMTGAGESAPAELPDWMASTDESAPGELPDWMAPAEASAPGGLPDWLSPAGAAAGAEVFPAAPQAEAPAQATELPDWMAAAGDEALSDWLTPSAGAAASPAAPDSAAADRAAPGAAPASSTAAGEVPDWLSAGGDAAWPGDEELDWLSSAADEAAETPGAAGEPAADAGLGAGEPSGAAELFETPDWLVQPDHGAALEPAAQPGMPDWMAAIAGATPGFSTAADGSALGEGDLSWLEQVQPEDGEAGDSASGDRVAELPAADVGLPTWVAQEPDEAGLAAAAPADLAPSELPGWLQAMRPVGAVGAAAAAADESEGVAGAGPLAGLRGALRAEPDISQATRPPAYTGRLVVSDLHRTQAELLGQLVAQEGQNPPPPGKPAITSLGVLRLAMAFLLILPVALSLFTGYPPAAAPAMAPEVATALELLRSVPPQSPVLLAVDYQPGYSGELDPIMQVVLRQLSERQAYLAMVSTLPTGPLQAEHLLAVSRQAQGPAWQSPQDYTNLGLVPGGASGLLAFAVCPAAVLPLDVNGEPVWQTQAGLRQPGGLAGFKLLIVAVDDPETARSWIEQVHRPLAGSLPLVVVSSAQAEPMVRPYYDAGQVQGLVSGLYGAAALEWATVQAGAGTRYWPAYTVGMLVAGVLMLVGILFNLISRWNANRKASRPADRPAAGSQGEAKS